MDSKQDSHPPSPPSSAPSPSPSASTASDVPLLPTDSAPLRLADRFKHFAGAGAGDSQPSPERDAAVPLTANAEEKPKRTRRSTGVRNCDSCRTRKQKCDRLQPCSNCALRVLTCTYAQAGPITSSGLSPLERNQGEIARLRREVNTLAKALGLSSQELTRLSAAAANGGAEDKAAVGKKRSLEQNSRGEGASSSAPPSKVRRYSSDDDVGASKERAPPQDHQSPPHRPPPYPYHPTSFAFSPLPPTTYPPWVLYNPYVPPPYSHHPHPSMLAPPPSYHPSYYSPPPSAAFYAPYPSPYHPDNIPPERPTASRPSAPPLGRLDIPPHRQTVTTKQAGRPSTAASDAVPPFSASTRSSACDYAAMRTPISSASSFPSSTTSPFSRRRTSFQRSPPPPAPLSQFRGAADSSPPSRSTLPAKPVLPSPRRDQIELAPLRGPKPGDKSAHIGGVKHGEHGGRTLPSLLAVVRSASEEFEVDSTSR
ncbi:hypothetical protein JCM6882_008133 [Rhodosporidiobolus microsporus]